MQFPEPTIERPVTPPAATVGSDLRNGESSNAGPLRYSPPELSHGIFAAMNFDKYILESSVYDEMFQPGGAPREHCRRLHETLSQLSVEELRAYPNNPLFVRVLPVFRIGSKQHPGTRDLVLFQ